MDAATIKLEYPIHWLVWSNDCEGIRTVLETETRNLELQDAKGRTPLHLAVSLGHLESIDALLNKGADVHAENRRGWSVLHEAISTGDPEITRMVLKHRDYRRASARKHGIATLIEQLQKAANFYVEMKWEFTSWIPFVTKMCPSDVYRVWKSGSQIRIDTTLLGFDKMSWQRGKRSFIFKGEGDNITVIEIDHDKQEAFIEELSNEIPRIESFLPTRECVHNRLRHPLVCTKLNTEKLCFEKAKGGLWGLRSTKPEMINGYATELFIASNVEFVTQTRTEHIDNKEDKKNNGGTNLAANALNSFLEMTKLHSNSDTNISVDKQNKDDRQHHDALTIEKYFDNTDRDIGRPIEMSTKVQKFKATVWQSVQYPLSMKEQIIPIIDLMAISNAHFAKLRDFINLKLPDGFPIKIEIPLYHVLNACITFGNFNGSDENSVPYLRNADMLEKAASRLACDIDSECFDVPAGYTVYRTACGDTTYDEDDQLLQLAIQQSLGQQDDSEMTFLEALNTTGSVYQRSNDNSTSCSFDQDIELAIQRSKEDVRDTAKKIEEEDDELQRIIRLSLSEK